jgi:uncharacterized repeat protein (TIGR01451 family)
MTLIPTRGAATRNRTATCPVRKFHLPFPRRDNIASGVMASLTGTGVAAQTGHSSAERATASPPRREAIPDRQPKRFRLLATLLSVGSLSLAAGTSPGVDRPDRLSILAHPWELAPPRAAVPSAGRALAAQPAVSPVRLKSGTFAGVGALEANAQAAFAGVPGTSRLHVLVQFGRLPNPAERASLAAAGLTLLGFVPDQAFFASLARDANLERFAAADVRWLGRLYPEDKLSPTLLAGQPGLWAVDPDGRVRLRLRVFEDVPLAVARAEVEQVGAAVLAASASTESLEVVVPLEAVSRLAALDALRWIEEVPPPLQTFNDGLRTNLQVTALGDPPYGLSGANVVVGIWDAGWLDFAHPDFTGRVHAGEMNVPNQNQSHATHVAGTLAGDGRASADRGGQPGQWRGVAPGATVISYDVSTGPLIEEHRDARERFGAVVAHNSWGITLDAFFGNCHLLGDYTGDAPNYDRLVTGLYGAPYHVVFAIGNARGRRDSTGCPSPDGYRTVGVPATAKNILTVGAVNSDDNSMTVFSGWGPTDDGRVKPEFVAPGDEVGGDGGITSTLPTISYGVMAGTSMAAPAVSGAVALLIEDYRQRFEGQTPLPSTVKGLLVHTAADLTDPAQAYHPGPDYASGYGRVQVREAVDHLRSGGWLVGQVTHGGQVSYPLDVPAEASTVKVTLVWDDVPAAENVARALVNDLDLVVTDPDGTRHFPWTLDPANPGAPAVRTVEDHVNVVEQVGVGTAVRPGRWTLTVRGSQIPSAGSQKFTLLYSPATTPGVPLLALEAATSSDVAAGNGNGLLDPGEEIEETVVLRNTDGPTAVGVTVQLATDSPHIHLLADTATYADIRPGAAGGNTTPLRYRVSKEAPCGHAFNLRLAATLGEHVFLLELPRVVGRLEVINVAREVFVAAAVPGSIPDAGTLRSPLLIERAGVVQDLQVEVRVDHTWLDDLRVTLEHPDGTAVELLPEGVFFGQNLGQGTCGPDVVWTRFDDAAASPITSGAAPLAGTFRPYRPLATLLNRPLEGEWELVIADVNTEDVGTLRCWQMSIEFAEQGYRCEPFNRPPLALDQQATFYRNRPDTLVLGASDPDEDAVTFGLVTPPAHGTIEAWDALTGTARYVPDLDYEGPDQFTFDADDGVARSAPATVTIDVKPATADLSVRQRISPRSPRHGQVFTVTLTITNRGPNQAQSGVLTNFLPPGVELLSAKLNAGTVTTVPPGIVGQLDPVPEAGSAVLTWTGRADVPGSYTNRVTVRSGEIEPTPNDNASALVFHVLETADLAITHQAAADPTPVGEPLELTLGVTNHGPYLASNVVVRSELAPGLRFVSATSSRGEWTHDEGVFLAHLGNLAVDDAVVLSLATVPEAAGMLTNVATVTTDHPDPDALNNTAAARTSVRHRTDLEVGWLELTQPVAAGHAFPQVLTLANRGPADAAEVTASIVLSPGLEWVAATASQGTAEAADGLVTWSAGALATEGTAELTLELRPTQLGWLTNVATVSAYEFEAQPENNEGAGLVEARAVADLAVGITAAPAPVMVGHPVVYTLSVTNLGPSAATEVELTYALPAGWELLEFVPSQGTATEVDDRITVACGALAVGAKASLEVRATPAVAGDAVHRLQAGGFEVDLAPANQALEVTWFVEEPADLGLEKRVEPAQVLASRGARYTLVVTNHGPYPASGVRATDVLPDPLAVAAVESSQGQAMAEAGTIAFEFGDLAVGQTATGRVEVLTVEPGTYLNAAYVSAAQPDLVPGNNSAEVLLEVLPAVDLELAQWTVLPPAAPHREARLDLVLTNRGPQAATGVDLWYALPEGVEFVAAEGALECVLEATNRRCHLGDVPVGGRVDVALILRPTVSGTLLIPISFASVEPELDLTNQSVEVPLEVPAASDTDLALTCAAEPAVVLNGQTLRLTLVASNEGPRPAEVAQVVSELPAQAELEDVELSQGEWLKVGDTVEMRLGRLEVGATATMTLTVRVGVSGTARQVAQVSSTQPDEHPANNACSTETEVVPAADLAVTKTVSPDPAILDDPVRLLLTVTNQGPDRATGVRLDETLIGTFDILRMTPSQGFWSLEAPGVQWQIGDLDPQAVATLDLLLQAPELGAITNRSAVVADQADPDPENNLAGRVTQVQQSGDLSLAVEVPTPPLILGQPAQYRFTVRNRGLLPATAILLRHPLPPALGLVSLTPSEGAAELTGPEVQWRLDELAAGAIVTLDVTVSPREPDRLTLSASVSGSLVDSTPSDNTVEFPVEIFGLASLALSQQVSPAQVLLGQSTVVELGVTNAGPHAATEVRVTDWLPAGLTLAKADLSQGHLVTNATGLVIELGRLEPGGEATARLRITALELGWRTNLAVVATDALDPDPADNLAPVAVEVLPSADLELAKEFLDPAALLGQPARFRLTVANLGPSRATQVQVVDPLPDDSEFVAAEPSRGSFRLDGDTFIFEPGPLDPGSTASVSLVLRPLNPGDWTNTAHALAQEGDPDPANNDARASTEVRQGADLRVQLGASVAVAVLGQPFDYYIAITNAGPHGATGVQLECALPTLARFESLETSQGEWERTGGTLAAHLGALPPGSVATLRVTVTPEAEGALVLGAAVSALEVDPAPENNQAEFRSDTRLGADLAVALWPESDDALAGHEFRYAVLAANHGPADAAEVTVTHRLPEHAVLVGVEADLGSWEPVSGQVLWRAGVLPVGTEAAAIVTVIVEQPGTLNATAQVHSPTFDPVLANNVVTFTGQAFSEADVLVYHEPLLPLLVDHEVTMAVVVTNRGNLLAPRVEMLVAFSLNVELLAAELSRGNHYLAPPGVVCNLGDLPPGTHARLTVTLRPTRVGQFVSQAGVVSPATSRTNPSTSNRLVLGIFETPVLVAERNPSRLALSWPLVAADYRLEFKDHLADPVWLPVLIAPVVEGDRLVVSFKPSSPVRFFRLRQE